MSNTNNSSESLSTNTLNSNSAVNDKRQKIECLVIDSGPLIKGTNVRSFAEKIYTVPEVISEIRDKHSRDFLNQISFDIQIKIPSDEALKEVVNFSKKTGDFTSLSAVDLRVLALTYMLEVEANGTERLRKEPIKPRTRLGGNNKDPNKSPRKKPTNKPESAKNVNKQEQQQQNYESKLVSNLENLQLTDITAENTIVNLYQVKNSEQSNDVQNNLNFAVGDNNLLSKDEPIVMSNTEKNSTNDSIIHDSDQKSVNQKIQDCQEGEEEEDDDIEWITPDNIDDYQAKRQNFSVNDNLDKVKIACMTTDYSMQNVLLQMRLNLISIEGKRIRKVKNWVFRCHSCFKITTNMEKKFCPKCGNATLIRTSASTDVNGNVTYYLKKNFQYNLRGTKYSIPEPKGGRHANNIILREDQKEYQKALKSQRIQKEIDIFDPDYIPKLLIGSSFSKSITPVIGYGRRNPNEAKRGKTKGRKKR